MKIRSCTSCRPTSTSERVISIDDYDEEEPIARWEALLLPDWTWEALEKEEDGLYYGRVKSPKTHDQWEYGYFTQEQLEEAGAYRVDTGIEDGVLYPDGGAEELARLYEAELDALQYFEPEDDSDNGECG